MVGRYASYALVAALAFAAGGCAASRVHVVVSRRASYHATNRIGPGPFTLSGGWVGGGGSGLWGDGPTGPRGTSLGCLDDRHYSYAFGIENRSKAPVTLTGARMPNPSPRIVDRVATQLRLSPPYHPTEQASFGDLVYRSWSDAPTRPVTIPPGRIATVQSNFLMRHCGELTAGQTITISGALVLGYRTAGRKDSQPMNLSGNRIVVVQGPTRRTCEPVSGSASLVAADTGCAVARKAAVACHPMQHDSWGDCTVAGRYWDCGRFAGPGYPLLETCYGPAEKSHWFSTVWIGGGLGLWGAIQNRTVKATQHAAEAAPATGGVCEVRPGARTLVYESDALPIVRGPAIARVPAVARVELSIPDYRGAGRYGARTAARVVTPDARYIGAGVTVTVVRAARGSFSGTVHASLRQKGGATSAFLNGTWSCRVRR